MLPQAKENCKLFPKKITEIRLPMITGVGRGLDVSRCRTRNNDMGKKLFRFAFFGSFRRGCGLRRETSPRPTEQYCSDKIKKPQSKSPEVLSSGGRIRTLTNGVRVRCATFTQTR